MKNTKKCKHQWAPLMAQVGKKNVPTSLLTCLKCGEMKVGKHTIRISKYRLDMGGLPITNIGGIALAATLSGDGTYSGITITGTAGATLSFGDLCYLNNDDSRWELADANLSDGYDAMLGICVLAGNDGDATRMLLFGNVRADTAFPSLTIGKPAYISETAGDIVVSAPTTADVCVRIVGYALTADELFFNPEKTVVIHT